MKLANVKIGGLSRVVLIVGEELIDLTAHLGAELDDVPKFLALGEQGRALAARCIKSAATRVPVSAVQFLAPVRYPDKVLGVGMNYHSFTAAARGIGMPIPTTRVWFLRPRGCVTNPQGDVWLPRGADDFDYEVELAVVIGRRCRQVSAADAAAFIGGYTVANDMTLREQVAKSLVLAKSFDTHTPMGPWIVTPDELGDPDNLDVKAWVNGELRQNGNTSDMIAGCGELIAELSAVCTLNPGDIILTGTPAGSGMFRPPPWGLAAGDVVKLEIERIGSIENRVVEEPRLG